MGWTIENNIVVFSDKRGNTFFPKAEDIFNQKDQPNYVFENELYRTDQS